MAAEKLWKSNLFWGKLKENYSKRELNGRRDFRWFTVCAFLQWHSHLPGKSKILFLRNLWRKARRLLPENRVYVSCLRSLAWRTRLSLASCLLYSGEAWLLPTPSSIPILHTSSRDLQLLPGKSLFILGTITGFFYLQLKKTKSLMELSESPSPPFGIYDSPRVCSVFALEMDRFYRDSSTWKMVHDLCRACVSSSLAV